MLRRLIFSLSVALGLASPLAAQAPDSISLDITVGPSSGSSSRTNYYYPGTAAGEFTLAYGPPHTTGRLYALTIGGNISYSTADICAIDEATPGKCKPIFPSTTHIGVLVDTI